MARIPWKFVDPLALTEYEFAINPKAGGYPDRRKKLTTIRTTAPGAEGAVLVFEGGDEVPEVSVSNVLLTEAQLDAFNEWYDKRHQVKVIDDLGRAWWIVISGVKAERERSVSHPFRHQYTLSWVVLGAAPVDP